MEQEGLARYRPWSHKEVDMTGRLNNSDDKGQFQIVVALSAGSQHDSKVVMKQNPCPPTKTGSTNKKNETKQKALSLKTIASEPRLDKTLHIPRGKESGHLHKMKHKWNTDEICMDKRTLSS